MSARREGAAAAIAALALAAALLGGCASLRDDAKAPPQGEVEAATQDVPPAVKLIVQAPDPLRQLLEEYLDLGRLRALVPDEPITDAELRRLEAATPAQARALLETEGYFDAEVKVERIAGEPPQVRVVVEPGRQVKVDSVDWHFEGPLQQQATAGDTRAVEVRDKLRHDWQLPPGAPFRSPAWSSAKSNAIAQLRAQGYASADWRATEARVDAVDHTAALALDAQSGPLYRSGEVRIEGLQRQDAQTVRNLANFKPGTPATEKLLLDYQDRLARAGLYSSATVTMEPDPARAEDTPIDVRIQELPLHSATLGLGVSALTGPRMTAEHTNRRILGLRATLRNKVELAKLRRAWEGELTSHTQPGLERNLVGGTVERLRTEDDIVTSARLRAGRAWERERLDRLAFVEIERASVDNSRGKTFSTALSANLHHTWRWVDSPLLPTDGVGLTLQTSAGHAVSDTGNGPYGRAYARLQYWKPLPAGWFGYARLDLGQVFVRDSVRIPDTQRFRAGGDGSVRGYAYRSLGPKTDGVVGSGNMLMTGSVEVAHPLTPRIPGLWGALFVDAGDAANRWNQLDPALGYGFGARYRSPIGPLSVDIAYGEREQRFRLHLSVGVQF